MGGVDKLGNFRFFTLIEMEHLVNKFNRSILHKHFKHLTAGLTSILLLATSISVRAAVVTTVLNPSNCHFYQLIATPNGGGGYDGLTWSAAEAEAISLGGHLVTINDASENNWVAQTFVPYRNDLWLGLNDQASEGNWVWSSGQTATYRNWLPSEPNGGTNENFASIRVDWQNKWIDLNGSYTSPFGVVELTTPVSRFDWNKSAGGLFGTAANWNPSGPPTANDAAYFDLNANYTVTFGASAANRLMAISQGQVTFNLGTRTYTPTDFYVAYDPGQTAALTVINGTLNNTGYAGIGENAGANGTVTVGTGGIWTTTGGLRVANYGTGTLNITGGGKVQGPNIAIGYQKNSSGTVTISGAGSQLNTNSGNFYVGNYGSGTIIVNNQAQLNTTNAWVALGWEQSSSGEVTVSGANSKWIVNNEATIGQNGKGKLTADQAGQISSQGMVLGKYWRGIGEATVTGTSSKLEMTNGGWLNVGREGTGTLNIQNGGTVNSISNGGILIGDSASGNGQVFVNGTGSSLNTTWELYVGNWGQGTLAVQAGAQVNAGWTRLGATGGSYGSIVVQGTNSRLNLASGCNLIVGQQGTGNLSISQGGAVNCVNGTYVGSSASGYGEIVVEGSNSALNTGDLTLGDSETSSGSVNVLQGGRITLSSGTTLAVGNSSTAVSRLLVSGAGSLVEQTNGPLKIGRLQNTKGEMRVENGGRVNSQWATIGSEHVTAQGTATVTDAGSLWNLSSDLNIGSSGRGILNVLNGGQVTVAGTPFIGREENSTGQLTISGANSKFTINGAACMNVFRGTLTITDGGVLEVLNNNGNAVYVADLGHIELAGGTIQAESLRFDAAHASLSGYGRVESRVYGFGSLGTDIVATGGKLVMGNPNSTDGFGYHGHASVQDNSTLELLDADRAIIVLDTTLANGVLIARNGAELQNQLLGYGIVVGPCSRTISTPTGTVNMTQTLDVGASVARVYSQGLADLGTLTTIDGGSLFAPRGVRFGADDLLSGSGTVSANVVLENGVINAASGKTMLIIGSLSGYGVTVGNVQAGATPISNPTGTVGLSQPFAVGNLAACVYSQGAASLGPDATLAGGSIAASQSLIVAAGQNISGYGTLSANVQLAGGTLRGDGGTLGVSGVLSGYGLLMNGISAPNRAAPNASLVFSGETQLGANNVTFYSQMPARIEGKLGLAGGSLHGGLVVGPTGMLEGYGTIYDDVLNQGVIHALGGTLTVAGALHGSNMAVGGSPIQFAGTGLFDGSGKINSIVSSAAGSKISATGELHMGMENNANGVNLAGDLLVGGSSVTLHDADAATLAGKTTLLGGMLSAPHGMHFTNTSLVIGHGTLDAGSTLASGIQNDGIIALSGGADILAPFTNQTGAQVVAAGGHPLTFWNTVVNNGQITAAEGTMVIYLDDLIGSGSMLVANGAEVRAKSIVQDTLTIGSNVNTTAVPEPSTCVMALLALTLGAIAFRRRFPKG
jgi:T5SS/PEP-CTERM-associated repeat protein